jgi:hypothetical protein
MKKLLFTFFLTLLVVFYGCSNNDSVTGSGSGLGGSDGGTDVGTNSGSVTIQVKGENDGQGYYIFYIKPSVAINLESVTATVTSESYEQTIDVNTQFTAGTFQACLQYPENNIQTGLKFSFKFVGTLKSNDKAFEVTTNYTIP